VKIARDILENEGLHEVPQIRTGGKGAIVKDVSA